MAPQQREWVIEKHPDLVQVTKTEDTSFEEFQELKIRVVNDDWSTPLQKIRCQLTFKINSYSEKIYVKVYPSNLFTPAYWI